MKIVWKWYENPWNFHVFSHESAWNVIPFHGNFTAPFHCYFMAGHEGHFTATSFYTVNCTRLSSSTSTAIYTHPFIFLAAASLCHYALQVEIMSIQEKPHPVLYYRATVMYWSDHHENNSFFLREGGREGGGKDFLASYCLNLELIISGVAAFCQIIFCC